MCGFCMLCRFASFDVVCDELHDCAWNVVCSSFLISVCMFIVSKALIISSDILADMMGQSKKLI